MTDENESEVSCPHCSESFDAWTVYEHNSGSETSRCPNCSEPVADDEWVSA